MEQSWNKSIERSGFPSMADDYFRVPLWPKIEHQISTCGESYHSLKVFLVMPIFFSGGLSFLSYRFRCRGRSRLANILYWKVLILNINLNSRPRLGIEYNTTLDLSFAGHASLIVAPNRSIVLLWDQMRPITLQNLYENETTHHRDLL